MTHLTDTVALADALASLTPEQCRDLARVLGPSPYLDQYLAASADAADALAQTAATWPTSRAVPWRPGDLPAPIWLQLVATVVAWGAEGATVCLHNPHPRRPQPVWAAAWKPGLIVCGSCRHLLRLPRNGPADRTCDLCGHVCPDEDGQRIAGVLVTYGPLTYSWGACPDCYRPELR